MPSKSRWRLSIPRVTLPTFLFGSPDGQIENGNAPALLDADQPERYHLTYYTYRLWSQRFALGLQKAGLQDGDAVMIFSTNTIFFPVVIMGAVMAGGKFTGANPTYVARELAHQLSNSESKFLLCSEASLDTVLEAVKMCHFPTKQIFIFDEGYDTFDGKGRGVRGFRHWSELLASEDEAARFEWSELGTPEQLNRTICLNYSSGTTGLAKGVEITHTNYVSNTLQHMFLSTLRPEFEEQRKYARWLCFLPLYHAMAQTVFCAGGPHFHIPVYIMKKFDFQKMLESVQNFKITELWLVPPVAVAMAKSPLTRKYDLSSVEGVGSGAAPLGPEVTRELEKLWPDGKINLKQGYGLTEVTCSALGWDPREHSDSFSVGEPNPNVEVKLMNDDGTQEVAAGDRGEVWIRGPNVMKGYWKNPKATQETLTEDGWLKTGDVAYIDTHGRFFIVDRIKELIKVKGLQVAPAELEALLLEHPAISDAAVIGVTIDEVEAPRAYVVKVADQQVTEEEVKDFIAKRASKHKWLNGGVKFVDSIMKNPSGKILRKKYREEAGKELEASAPRARL